MNGDPVEAAREVVVDRVMYRAADGEFAVVRVRDGADATFVAAGLFPFQIMEGDPLLLRGRLEHHDRYGERFRVEDAEPRLPVTEEGVRRYLRSGRIRGVGKKLADRLVDAFGEDTLKVLEEAPERVLDVPGVGRSRLEEIRRVFSEGRQLRETLAFLQGLGLGRAVATEIWRKLGAGTLGRVRENPYALTEEVHGVGFQTADRMGRALGLEATSPRRVQAGLRHVLVKAIEQGHTCVPAQDLADRATNLLGVDSDVVRLALLQAAREGNLRCVRAPRDATTTTDDDDADGSPKVYLPALFAAEKEVASRFLDLARAPRPPAVPTAGEDDAFVLTDEQIRAVRTLLSSKVSLLTGGPGVGKTTVLRTVVDAYWQAGFRVALASPTGRASRRLAQATGREASTLHRLFGLIPGAPQGGKVLDADVLVVDEASMVDLLLMLRVLRRVPREVILILVGDPDQLPSVGPGSVLSDFIAADGVPVVQLSQVFRQAEGSQIVANAHRINRGEMPVFPDRGGGGDCFFIAREDPQAGGEMVRHLFTERIPDRFGLDPRSDIQILCPMHRGATGTEALNRLIQEALNHDRPSLEHRGRIYHEGDRVMQTRNDYDTDIMNGDMGVVLRLDPVAGSVEVAFEGRTVLLQRQHLTDLEPAFAVTVHKSQGGEYPAVILPLFGEHHLMLRRNVLYTAVTRAQRLLVIVGTHKALHQAVRDDRMLRRSTELRAFLEGRPPVDVAPFEGE